MAITLWFPLMAETCWNPGHGMFTIDQLVLAYNNIIYIYIIYTSLYLSVPGWWYTYPSEKNMSSSIGIIIPFHSQLFLESHNPAMFQTTSLPSIVYGYSMEFPTGFSHEFPQGFPNFRCPFGRSVPSGGASDFTCFSLVKKAPCCEPSSAILWWLHCGWLDLSVVSCANHGLIMINDD